MIESIIVAAVIAFLALLAIVPTVVQWGTLLNTGIVFVEIALECCVTNTVDGTSKLEKHAHRDNNQRKSWNTVKP
jgi:hypothetical protein